MAKSVASAVTDETTSDVAIFVPFPFIESVSRVVGDKFTVGAEMVSPNMKGAFTGDVSAPMLKSCGVQWALAGHSERRTINTESDEYINGQCKALIENGMSVILCIGETLEEYEKGLVGNVCEVQLKKGLCGISAEEMDRVVIAYERKFRTRLKLKCVAIFNFFLFCYKLFGPLALVRLPHQRLHRASTKYAVIYWPICTGR